MEQTTTYMSESIDQLIAALANFQGELKQPSLNKDVSVKTKQGYTYKFKYADLGECMRAAAPGLAKHGLAVSQIISGGHLLTVLGHKSGQWLRSEVNIGVERISDYQGLGSAITYLKRYSYCAILGIVADTDDDANAACGNEATFVNKGGQQPAANNDAVLNEALAAVAKATTADKVKELWAHYQQSCPAICVQGTPFFNAVAQRGKELKAQEATA